MKIIDLLKYCFGGIACVVTLSSVVVAQGGFDLTPGPDDSDQDEPVIVRPSQDRSASKPFQLPPSHQQDPDQSVLLNVKYVGWQGAGTGDRRDRLSDELRSNWIQVDANGQFEGHVTAGEGADVRGMVVYLLNRGRLVKNTTVGPEGNFAFSNIRRGAYAMVGWGAKGFFAFGLNIVESKPESVSHEESASDDEDDEDDDEDDEGGDEDLEDDSDEDTPDPEPSLPNSIRVTAFQNVSSINTDWIRFFAPRVNYRVYGRYPFGEGQDDDPALYGIQGLFRNPPKAKPATSISSHSVARTASGGIRGRVHQLTSETGRPVDVRTTKIMLLKGDEVVAKTDADNFGVFELPNVPAGEYGLAAVGVDGMGLIGINVGEDTSMMNSLGEFASAGEAQPFDFCLVSSETIGWLNNYASELAYRRNLLAPRRPSPDANKRTCPTCDGGGCQQCKGTGICSSRCQSFEDWANNCCRQRERTKLGSGYILSEASKDLRKNVQRTNRLFENAFYGGQDGGGYSGNGSGYPQQPSSQGPVGPGF